MNYNNTKFPIFDKVYREWKHLW